MGNNNISKKKDKQTKSTTLGDLMFTLDSYNNIKLNKYDCYTKLKHYKLKKTNIIKTNNIRNLINNFFKSINKEYSNIYNEIINGKDKENMFNEYKKIISNNDIYKIIISLNYSFISSILISYLLTNINIYYIATCYSIDEFNNEYSNSISLNNYNYNSLLITNENSSLLFIHLTQIFKCEFIFNKYSKLRLCCPVTINKNNNYISIIEKFNHYLTIINFSYSNINNYNYIKNEKIIDYEHNNSIDINSNNFKTAKFNTNIKNNVNNSFLPLYGNNIKKEEILLSLNKNKISECTIINDDSKRKNSLCKFNLSDLNNEDTISKQVEDNSDIEKEFNFSNFIKKETERVVKERGPFKKYNSSNLNNKISSNDSSENNNEQFYNNHEINKKINLKEKFKKKQYNNNNLIAKDQYLFKKNNHNLNNKRHSLAANYNGISSYVNFNTNKRNSYCAYSTNRNNQNNNYNILNKVQTKENNQNYKLVNPVKKGSYQKSQLKLYQQSSQHNKTKQSYYKFLEYDNFIKNRIKNNNNNLNVSNIKKSQSNSRLLTLTTNNYNINAMNNKIKSKLNTDNNFAINNGNKKKIITNNIKKRNTNSPYNLKTSKLCDKKSNVKRNGHKINGQIYSLIEKNRTKEKLCNTVNINKKPLKANFNNLNNLNVEINKTINTQELGTNYIPSLKIDIRDLMYEEDEINKPVNSMFNNDNSFEHNNSQRYDNMEDNYNNIQLSNINPNISNNLNSSSVDKTNYNNTKNYKSINNCNKNKNNNSEIEDNLNFIAKDNIVRTTNNKKCYPINLNKYIKNNKTNINNNTYLNNLILKDDVNIN